MDIDFIFVANISKLPTPKKFPENQMGMSVKTASA